MHKANKTLEKGYKYTRPTFHYTHSFKRISKIGLSNGKPIFFLCEKVLTFSEKLRIIEIPQSVYFDNEIYTHFNIDHKGYNLGRIISLIAFTNSFMVKCGQVVVTDEKDIFYGVVSRKGSDIFFC